MNRSDEPTVALEALPAPALVVAEGQVTAANAAARDLLGDDLRGTTLGRLFPSGLPDASPDSTNGFDGPNGPDEDGSGDTSPEAGPFHRVRATPAEGDPVEVAVALGDAGDGALLLVVPVDHVAGHSEDLQAFVSGVSHDLKQPLSVISGYLELLGPAVEAELDEAALDNLQGARTAADRADRLLDDLLTYAQVGLGETGQAAEPVDLNDVLDEIVDELPARWADEASVEVAALPTVRGQRSQFARLFENLVSNALKYQEEAPRRVCITAEEDAGGEDGSCRVTVEDDGVGIDPDEVDDLFELFERGRAGREVEGNGVGLALCRGIVEDLDGRIEVESDPGDGSAFHVGFPATVVAAPPRESAGTADTADEAEPESGTRSVVLVDDVEGLRSLVRTVLEKTGRYEVVGEAETGEEGIEVAAETEPDVVLLDLSMPRMDGLEALPEIRTVAPDADVVIYSGFQKGRMVEKAEERGAVGYIEKGANPGEIVEQLEAALGDGTTSGGTDPPESAGSVS